MTNYIGSVPYFGRWDVKNIFLNNNWMESTSWNFYFKKSLSLYNLRREFWNQLRFKVL